MMHIIKFYEMNQFVNYKTVREGSLVTKVTEFYNIHNYLPKPAHQSHTQPNHRQTR